MPKKYIEAKTTIDQGLKNRKIMKIGCASGNAGRVRGSQIRREHPHPGPLLQGRGS